MGAIENANLTNETTHLLVGATDSDKYKFVARVRNDVVVLKPEWIEAVRRSWIEGEDTDIRSLEEKYKLPTFDGLTLCITGFTDSELNHPLSGPCKMLITYSGFPYQNARYCSKPRGGVSQRLDKESYTSDMSQYGGREIQVRNPVEHQSGHYELVP